MIRAFRRRVVPIALALLAAVLWLPARTTSAERRKTPQGDREEMAVVRTPLGEIVWRFLPAEAPEHCAAVRELIRRGFYDGTTFHRVIPHFVIQGGDPNSKNEDRSDDGEGEADRRLKAEFSARLHYRPGTVGMARDADPDSGSCQFFIALGDLPRLDGRYSIFGEVVEGLEVARRIAALPRDLNDNPLEAVPMTVRLEKRASGGEIRSLQAGGPSAEVLTGPGKPRPFDARNTLWSGPERMPESGGPAESVGPPAGDAGPAPSKGVLGSPRLELVVGEDGGVLDVRFPKADTSDAGRLRAQALGWRFRPARYDGRNVKVRFETDETGEPVWPPTGGGAPVEVRGSIAAPRPMVLVELPPGREVPDGAFRVRLIVDAEGKVADAALQQRTGDDAADAAVVEAAKRMRFSPAMRADPTRGTPEAVPVYLDIEARFIAAGG